MEITQNLFIAPHHLRNNLLQHALSDIFALLPPPTLHIHYILATWLCLHICPEPSLLPTFAHVIPSASYAIAAPDMFNPTHHVKHLV